MKKLFVCISTVLTIAMLTAAAGAEDLTEEAIADVALGFDSDASTVQDAEEESYEDTEYAETDSYDSDEITYEPEVEDDPDDGEDSEEIDDIQVRYDSKAAYGAVVDDWAKNGYPEDLSFVYLSGGEMIETADDAYVCSWVEIGLINADETRKDYYRSLFGDECKLSFFECTYSYNERLAIRDEIKAMNDSNIVDVIMLYNDEGIQVFVNNITLEDEYKNTFTEKYGSLVIVSGEYITETGIEDDALLDEVLTGVDYDTGIGAIDASEETTDMKTVYLVTGIAFVALALFITTLVVIRRRSSLKQTAEGTVISSGNALSKDEAIKKIKESEIHADDELLDKIKDKLD